jgi:uncharacterized protein
VAGMDRRGVVGDRRWAVYTDDGGIGSGKTTRRFRRVDGLLELRATLDGAVVPLVHFPSGPLAADDEATGERLSAVVGRSVRLRPEGEVPHHDESPVHLITTAALRSLADRIRAEVAPALPPERRPGHRRARGGLGGPGAVPG